MKAIVVNPYWDSMGGGERYVASFVQLLLHNNWTVDIKWPSPLATEIESRFALDIHQAKYVSDFSSRDYHLLFHLSDGSIPTSLAKKTIIHFQFPFQNISGKSLPNLVKTRFYAFVVNSQFTKQAIDQEFWVNSHIVYPPVDTQKFHTNQKKTKTIYYVGRFSNLTQLKGQSILIEAFKAISPQLPGWNLVLAGGFGVGSDQTLLNAMQVASRGYPITFMLNPDFSALKHLHATSQIFWSASGYSPSPASLLQQEHFGISLVEAMASGSVPIVTKLGGHTEIVTHGQDGLLWTTPDELKSQTLEVINSRQLPSLSLAAIARSKMYDIASFNSNFLQLL